MNDQPFIDHVAPILRAEPNIDDSDRELLWDLYHESADHNALARELGPLNFPNDLKSRLYDAKKQSMPEENPVISALNKLKTIEPRILDLAEKHSKVASFLVSDALK